MHGRHARAPLAKRRKFVTSQRAAGMKDQFASPCLRVGELGGNFCNHIIRNCEPDNVSLQRVTPQHRQPRVNLPGQCLQLAMA